MTKDKVTLLPLCMKSAVDKSPRLGYEVLEPKHTDGNHHSTLDPVIDANPYFAIIKPLTEDYPVLASLGYHSRCMLILKDYGRRQVTFVPNHAEVVECGRPSVATLKAYDSEEIDWFLPCDFYGQLNEVEYYRLTNLGVKTVEVES